MQSMDVSRIDGVRELFTKREKIKWKFHRDLASGGRLSFILGRYTDVHNWNMLFCHEIPKTQRYISVFMGFSSDENLALREPVFPLWKLLCSLGICKTQLIQSIPTVARDVYISCWHTIFCVVIECQSHGGIYVVFITDRWNNWIRKVPKWPWVILWTKLSANPTKRLEFDWPRRDIVVYRRLSNNVYLRKKTLIGQVS